MCRTCSEGGGVNGSLWRKWPAECYVDESTDFQKTGNHILFTVRTTASLHSQRLPLLFQTWLSAVNRSNVVLVTDGQDRVLQFRAQEAGFNTIPLLLLERGLIRMLLVLFAGIRTLSSVPGYNRYGMYVYVETLQFLSL